jgi:hypothetical protein
MRWLALACLCLVSAISTAQAVHIHGEWLPNGGHHATAPADASQLPGGEEHCSLCVAMHSAAMPVQQTVALPPIMLVAAKVVERATVAPETRWHFAMFSRPPPMVSI